MFLLRLAFGFSARVGKSESSDFLVKKYGGKELFIAKPVYDILGYAQDTCGFSREKDRKFLQFVGQWARDQNENVWINILNQEKRLTENIFISDLRYLNEAKILKENGFSLINITRDSFTGVDYFGSGSRTHESEISLEGFTDWDFVINNNGTLQELHQQLDNIVVKISQKSHFPIDYTNVKRASFD